MGKEFIMESEDIGIWSPSGLGTKHPSYYLKATLLHEIVWWRLGLVPLLEFSLSKDVAA